MKTLYVTILFLITFSITHSQDIISTLAGNTSEEGFSVVNAQGDTVFRITGEGNVGIGTSNPAGLLDTRRTVSSDSGKSIYLQAESLNTGINGPTGGKITLKGPTEGNGGDIDIIGGSGHTGGDINIISGDANGASAGGKINIIAESGNQPGNVNIEAYSGNSMGSHILITAHGEVEGGEITLQVGNGEGGGSINLLNGDDGGDINLTAGAGDVDDGGNINLTPGNGYGGQSGLVVINGSGTYSGTWTQASDERYKKNILPLENAVDKINQLQGVSYDWKVDEFPEKNFEDGTQLGLVAQDVEKILPELVRTDAEGYKSIAYQNLVSVLVEAIKEQQKQIENLDTRIQTLEKEKEVNVVKVSSVDK